jgi:hypothetical protein
MVADISEDAVAGQQVCRCAVEEILVYEGAWAGVA